MLTTFPGTVGGQLRQVSLYLVAFKLSCFTKYIEIGQNRLSLIMAHIPSTDMSDTVTFVQSVNISVLLLSLVE
jgi:hypothetical protein